MRDDFARRDVNRRRRHVPDTTPPLQQLGGARALHDLVVTATPRRPHQQLSGPDSTTSFRRYLCLPCALLIATVLLLLLLLLLPLRKGLLRSRDGAPAAAYRAAG